MRIEKPIIDLCQGVVSDPNRRFREPIDFRLNSGEHIAIMGLNGAGKSILIETILGGMYLKQGSIEFEFGNTSASKAQNISHVTFRDTYGGTADSGYYYQQRWNSSDRENVPTVRELLGEYDSQDKKISELFQTLNIEDMLDKYIILLSSGELRKFQIAKMLLRDPKILIVESPYIGLDAAAREVLDELFTKMCEQGDVQIIFTVSSPKDVPTFISHVYVVEDMVCSKKMSRSEFFGSESFTQRREQIVSNYNTNTIALPAPRTEALESEYVVELNNVNINYGDRKVLEGFDWSIKCGEKWALLGPNGSGKSTLLSLIAADNPRAYSQDITLFGRKRGSGESIWDIKKHIGYLSPEMHRSYIADTPAIDIVASGFFDSVGLYHTANDTQKEVCREWLKVVGMEDASDRSFVKLSSGEQRLLLFLRAFVKDPDLLILDEPLHGLDSISKEHARAIIESFCSRPNKSMIYVTHYTEELPRCVAQTKTLTLTGL